MQIHTIQFNIEKFLGGTASFDATEIGAYMCLLIACYQADNKIPSDDKRLARMARVTPKVWARIKPTIARKFTEVGGQWTHSRVQKEIDKYQSMSTKNRANALKKQEPVQPLGPVSLTQNPANINNNNQVTSNKNIDDVVVARASVLIGQEIAELCGQSENPRWIGNYQRVETWLRGGWTRDDIIPTVKAVLAARGSPPSSINYFEQPIANAIAAKNQPLPKGEIRHARPLTKSERADAAMQRALDRLDAEDERQAIAIGFADPAKL